MHVRTAFEALPWSNVEIPLGYRRAAQALARMLGEEPVVALARGYVKNDECVACLTPVGLRWAAARALTTRSERWDFPNTWASTRPEPGRLVIELTGSGRRSVLRLVDEAQSQELVRRLDETLNPKPTITFRPFTPRA